MFKPPPIGTPGDHLKVAELSQRMPTGPAKHTKVDEVYERLENNALYRGVTGTLLVVFYALLAAGVLAIFGTLLYVILFG
jgi:hypothetical protein